MLLRRPARFRRCDRHAATARRVLESCSAALPRSSVDRLRVPRFAGRLVLLVGLWWADLGGNAASAADPPNWIAGVAKVDVTPREPVRLSGYANRELPSEGVADRLSVRALSLRTSDESLQACKLLVSIDTIGVPAVFTHRIAEEVKQRWGIARPQIVLCCTHSHTAPQLAGALTNLLTEPLRPPEVVATERYTEELRRGILQAIEQALANEREVTLSIGEGTADFAVNRRVIQSHRWTGFGVTPDGPRSTRVPVMLVADRQTEKPLAISYLYACHCTTMGPETNVVSGDWAGMSATELEAAHPGAIALPVIGCGADINPEPRTGIELARQHGKALATAVSDVIQSKAAASPLRALPPSEIAAHFGYAGLAPERPTPEQLVQALEDESVHRRRWARQLLELIEQMGRIPETYPAPIHSWQWGDQLTWVFLGGEVVVDYQLRLERELAGESKWIAAYTDDVFGYVASERVRSEGGYEVDDSMLFYSQPGRWQSGTEELLVKRIHDVIAETQPEDEPLEPADALHSFDVPPGFELQLVACEPLVQDPVNLAFDARGRLWVVEMGDYPLGNGGRGGCVKILTDEDRDGRFDSAQVFLDHLSYPTGAFPWRDGVVVSCAPEVFFARDTDGDGRADERRVLLEGFPEVNPQHRVSGFSYGLDHRLHFGCGEAADQVRGPGLPEPLAISGRDLSLDIESGQASTTSGTTQFIRSRDDWGNWFGNSNSEPGFHYVLEDAELRMADTSVAGVSQSLYAPAWSPPVFPLSRTVDRFNDLHTANCFTSACSGIVGRVPALRITAEQAAGTEAFADGLSYLVCEPVHNLVHRSAIVPRGASFAAVRTNDERDREFFRSSDPWFRPVRVENGPDGCVWVVDMYRLVIEHPEWIPLAWQAQLDLRAGADRGRIYRLVPKGQSNARLPDLSDWSSDRLADALDSPIGPLRDLAQQQIIWRADRSAEAKVRELARSASAPSSRGQALATLAAAGWLQDGDLQVALDDADERVVRSTVRQFGVQIRESADRRAQLRARLERATPPLVLAGLVTLGIPADGSLESEVVTAALRTSADPWIRTALPLLDAPERAAVLLGIHRQLTDSPTDSDDALRNTLADLIRRDAQRPEVRALVEALANASLERTESGDSNDSPLIAQWLQAEEPWETSSVPASVVQWIDRARKSLLDRDAALDRRTQAVERLGALVESRQEDLRSLTGLLDRETPESLQLAALRRLSVIGDPGSGIALLAQWPNLSNRLRSQLVQQLAQRQAWRDALASAIQGQQLALTDLDAAALAVAREALPTDLWKELTGTPSAASATDRAAVVERFAQQVGAAGDPQRGEPVFRMHCANCHAAQTGQPPIGPPLEGLTDRSPIALLTAILDPNRAIEAKYRQMSLLTTDGRLLRGVLIQEQAGAIVLGLADGTRTTVERDDVEQFEPIPISLMPDGFEGQVSAEQLGDLVAYLQQLR